MKKHSALFLDRDGVVNADHGYVRRPAEFDLVDGILDLCVAAQDSGLLIVIVTNQSGIGRGYFSEETMNVLHAWMRKRFMENGVFIDAIYHCPFHPDAAIAEFRQDSVNRKPNPGMLLQAAADLDVSLGTSIMIGDKASDIEAGIRAGVGNLFLFDKAFSVDLRPTSFGFQCGSLRTIADVVPHLFGTKDERAEGVLPNRTT